MSKITGLVVSAFVLCFGFVGSAAAGSLTGNYGYAITGQPTDSSCTLLGGDGLRDTFDSNSGGNSIAADPVAFSICDGIDGYLEGGLFTISDGSGDSATGSFSGVLTGLSEEGGDIFQGGFTLTSESGYYAGLTEDSGTFQVTTGPVNTQAFVTGTFEFATDAPEPVTSMLAGSGLLLLGLSRKLRKPRG